MKLNNNLYGISGGLKCGKDLVGEMIQYFASVTNPTFEDFMEKNLYENVYEVRKFADKLKECVAIIIGCTRKQLEDQEFKNTELGPEWWYYKVGDEMYPIDSQYVMDRKDWDWSNAQIIRLTPRLILQLLGTEGGRKIIHPNIWVNSTFTDYEVESSKWIITDLRFPNNEGKAITTRNGLTIGVKRHFGLRFPEYAFRQYEDRPYDIPSMLMNDNEELFDLLNHESETAMGDNSWCDVVIENNGTIEELFDKVLQVVAIQESII